MLLLGINTATPATALALVDSNKVLFDKTWLSHHDEAEKLLPELLECMQTSSQSIEGLLVVHGPGSFSGLRIGITIANTFAFVQKIPLYSISTFVYWWKRIPLALQPSTALVARAGGDHLVIVLPETFSGSEDRVLSHDFLETHFQHCSFEQARSFLVLHPEIKFLAGDLSLEQRDILAIPSQIQWLTEESLVPWPSVVQQCIPLIQEKVLPPSKQVEPYYLNPPHITKSKKG